MGKAVYMCIAALPFTIIYTHIIIVTAWLCWAILPMLNVDTLNMYRRNTPALKDQKIKFNS